MRLLLVIASLILCGAQESETPPQKPQVFSQAHRGALREAPENTLLAFRHAWAQPGAIPEVDVRITRDGYYICLHDKTLARTTDAPEPVRNTPVDQLLLADIRKWNAAARFKKEAPPQQVPLLREVFALMAEQPERRIYLDVKDVDLETLATLMDEFGITKRVLFVHGEQARCKEIQERFPGAITMTWCSGDAESIKKCFNHLAETNFEGLSQVQFHLKPAQRRPVIQYQLSDDYLAEAIRKTCAHGVELQLRPFVFDAASLRKLLDLGVRWYVADEPEAFANALAEAQEKE
ncbi:MAG: glycerophosphodiester phosphodiesterase family protein [Candidatus Hydrogenedentes bacterium]|nr:glycerophosphodiester phosphodiesterase family protein [Candidatus Hydrogenedentota bacterium]